MRDLAETWGNASDYDINHLLFASSKIRPGFSELEDFPQN
jgi:hypothetical protein